MATAEAIYPGLLILLLYLQNSFAQQCLNNGYKNIAGFPQQNIQKSPCGSNQIAQNGLNLNSLQQGNAQQVNYQQQSNIQPASFKQASNQPQLNLQQSNSLQPVNALSNSQLLKQSNQDLTANILSSLYNIQQTAQNQRGTRNIVKGNPSQQNYEQPPSQNQLNPAVVSALVNQPQNSQPTISNSGSEYTQPQPAFTFKFVPNNNGPVQSNQQVLTMPVQKASSNDPNQSYSVQSQPPINPVPKQQATTMQNPIIMFSGTQSNTASNQPIVLALQSPQTPTVQNQPTLLMNPTSRSQPIIYALQTQPSFGQNQQISGVSSQSQILTTSPMDKQSLIPYVVSQMQNSQGNNNLLASILPAMLNTKSEKSSSMKSLLPLILNMISEKKNCCGCPHCGHNANNTEQPKPEPMINSGYSNHINYSQQKTAETDKNLDSTKIDVNQEQSNDAEVNNSTETSEEDEAEPNYSEESDEE